MTIAKTAFRYGFDATIFGMAFSIFLTAFNTATQALMNGTYGFHLSGSARVAGMIHSVIAPLLH